MTEAPVAEPPPGHYERPVEVALRSGTPGSVVVYTTAEGDDARWLLYHRPVFLDRDVVLRLRAGRLGFFDSEEQALSYRIGAPRAHR